MLFEIAAIVLIGMGLETFAGAGTVSAVPGWAFVVGGVLAYAGLAYVTAHFFQRPVTIELLLFVLWAG